ncbi:MAG: hypothetical protein IJJ60_08505 [Clostridia bacterium]|nr:hypothetical protein [Clostridia bacterium]
MRLWIERAVHRPRHRAAARALIAALLLLALLPSALGETLRAYCDPDTPPPFVPEHAPVGDDYFSDAVFIGDSMMEYWEIYELLPTASFVWQVGMSPMSVGRKQFRVAGSNEKISTYDQAALYHPAKIYVWLGANGLDTKNSELVLEDYEKMADELIAHFPDALIYVISPPPMTWKRATQEKYPVAPRRYENFEGMLRELAARRNFYYIDAYHLVTGENGYMRGNCSIGDGFHLNRTALGMVTDYIRAHTAPYRKTEENPQ